MLALTCLDVRGDRKCSDCRPLVDPYQRHLQWDFGDRDDGHDTHRGGRFELGFNLEPWIRVHRNFHQRDRVSRWSSLHGLRGRSYAAFLQRRSFGLMFSNDLGVCTRPGRARA